MFIKYLLMAVAAFSGGAIVSSGVFTVLVAVGLIPRFAGKTHTARHIFLYEEMIVLGTIAGSFFSVYQKYGQLGKYMKEAVGMSAVAWNGTGNMILAVYGLFSGIFVGCLALAIAEMLDSIPIYTRRISLHKGLGFMVCAMAAGKMIGALIFFAYGFYR